MPGAVALITGMKALLAILLAAGTAMTACAGEADSSKRTLVVRKIKPSVVTGTNIARPVELKKIAGLGARIG